MFITLRMLGRIFPPIKIPRLHSVRMVGSEIQLAYGAWSRRALNEIPNANNPRQHPENDPPGKYMALIYGKTYWQALGISVSVLLIHDWLDFA